MKFKVKIVVGVDFPGMGVTRRNKELAIEATSIEDAFSQATAQYRAAFNKEPTDFAAWQITVALDTDPTPAA